MNERSKSDLNEIREVKEIMDVISKSIPSLLSGIKNALFDSESSKQLAENTANFYGELVEQGLDEDKAYELTREYLKSNNFSQLVTDVLSSIGVANLRKKEGKNIGKTVEKRLREEKE